MSLRRFVALIPALVVFVSVGLVAQTSAPNVTGIWKGTFKVMVDDQPVEDSTAHLVLTQTGADVAGTAGPTAEQQMPITKGKFATVKDVSTVTFEVTTEGPVMMFDLKLVKGRLQGTAKAEFDGKKFRADLDLERAK